MIWWRRSSRSGCTVRRPGAAAGGPRTDRLAGPGAWRMIIYKSRNEIETMDRCNRVVARILGELARQVQPGVTTKDLDRKAERMCQEAGVRPAFKGYRG